MLITNPTGTGINENGTRGDNTAPTRARGMVRGVFVNSYNVKTHKSVNARDESIRDTLLDVKP